ncbi:hypothetical protein AVO42_08140 [Thiomicrospira sp. XS5]|uniref:right-handed parallel beta-helix repeat-containing protein n=1 Tax=Thiomicrospira sp. XS5 TaxID=1775636 RepID=UPI00074B1A90|nr:right-handed parallel beta-helix repeat-containing protein [Thiomicrospira sp. XS5]KUJ75293.1 hypothetical protein AVO42_08140 [Thiomicrospira sp. XS5]
MKKAFKRYFVLLFTVSTPFWLSSCNLFYSDGDTTNNYTIWVSPDGDDANSGRSGSPFKTIQRAQQEAREIADSPTNITVKLKEGVYRLDETLTFDASDSPQNGFMVTYKSQDGADVRLYGSKQIDNWTLCDAGKNIYCANAKGLDSRQLYINGERATRARTGDYPGGFWPYYGYNSASPANSDPGGILFIPVQNMDSSLDPNWPDPNTWRNIEDIEAVSLPQWKMQRVPLKSITSYPNYDNTNISAVDEILFYIHEITIDVTDDGYLNYDLSKTGLITLQDPAWTNSNLYLNKDKTATNMWSFFRVAFFENAYEFLDEKGEWYLDKNQDTVYYIPLDGQDMSIASAEMPFLQKLITVTGSQSEPVKNLRFQNLNFAYATWMTPSTNIGYVADQSGNLVVDTTYNYNSIGHVQYVQETPGNIELEYVNGVVFDGNIFEHMGAVALHFGTGTQNSVIRSNLFEDISSSAIWLGGVQQKDYAPNSAQITQNNTISNNLIRHVGQEYYDVAGIYVGFSTNTLIDHNTIMYTPWSAIAMGWGWGLLDPGINLGLSTATPYMWGVHTDYTPNSDNKITNNRTYSTLEQLWDGGGVYTTGYQGSSAENALLIEGNVFSDKNPNRGGNTVYSDGMSRHINVKNNVMYNNPQAKAFFGTDITLNDPFYIQYAIFSLMNDVGYGYDTGGCRTYGDIAYDGNFWHYDEFFNICPFTYEGTSYPTALSYSGNQKIATNIPDAQIIANDAGVTSRPSSIPASRWITPSKVITLN